MRPPGRHGARSPSLPRHARGGADGAAAARDLRRPRQLPERPDRRQPGAHVPARDQQGYPMRLLLPLLLIFPTAALAQTYEVQMLNLTMTEMKVAVKRTRVYEP